MVKTTFLNYFNILSVFLIVSFSLSIEAQIVIGKPVLEFSQACANDTFNSFTTNFVISPVSGLGSTNQFSIELSDASGDFSNPQVIYTSNPGSINTSPATIDFSLPTTTAGEGYRIRVTSSQPIATSTPSNSFAAYYKLQDSPFTINNLVSTASFCPGGSYLLTIDNPGSGINVSPLIFPSLTFNWFKEITPTSSVLVSQGPTLTVHEEGVYFVETDYGSCTSDSYSNRVTVSEAIAGDEVIATISSSLGNPFCSADGPTTLSTVSGNTYQWYRDGTLISGATNQTYQTDISGVYKVRIGYGTCEATGSIDLQSGDFTSSLNIPTNNLLVSGETLNVEVTTTAINPEFRWLLNNEVIQNATQNTYELTDFGSYTVFITQTEGCLLTTELNFQVDEFIDTFPDVEKIPNLISPNGDGINDVWIIPQQYVSGTGTELIIFSGHGDTVLKTNDYMNNWPEEQPNFNNVNPVYYYIITPVNKEPIKGSITIIK